MFELHNLLIALCLFLGAILYTSVGHAGASAYIAVMTLFDLPAVVIKPTALTLNIAVSSFTSWRYINRGLFNKRLFLLLSIGAVPAAFIGGHIVMDDRIYKPIIGALLIFSGMRFLFTAKAIDKEPQKIIPVLAVFIGLCIGLLSGITGTGGGIFLSPLIIWLGWTNVRQASGTVAAFIFLNSAAGLLGNFASTKSLPNVIPLFLVAVLAGALIGTRFGTTRFSHSGIKRALGCVLIVAGIKFLLVLA
ncbi:MAG: sulfite exporter TauE/SafE family protein [Candidatus Planktophila sp.]